MSTKSGLFSVMTHFKLFDNDQGWRFQFWIHLETEEEGGNGLILREREILELLHL